MNAEMIALHENCEICPRCETCVTCEGFGRGWVVNPKTGETYFHHEEC
jgi:hypothetical protein